MTVYKGNAEQTELSQGNNAFAEAYKGGSQIYKNGITPGEFGQRVENVCTVVGTRTNASGQNLAYAILDQQYRIAAGYIWGPRGEATGLTSYTGSTYMNDPNSATDNTDYILNNFSANNYPAFKLARNAMTIKVNKKTYKSQLPTATELKEIYKYKSKIEILDPTTTGSLSGLAWASQTSGKFIGLTANLTNGTISGMSKESTTAIIIPVFEFLLSDLEAYVKG